jgi:hypothetical protein
VSPATSGEPEGSRKRPRSRTITRWISTTYDKPSDRIPHTVSVCDLCSDRLLRMPYSRAEHNRIGSPAASPCERIGGEATGRQHTHHRGQQSRHSAARVAVMRSSEGRSVRRSPGPGAVLARGASRLARSGGPRTAAPEPNAGQVRVRVGHTSTRPVGGSASRIDEKVA